MEITGNLAELSLANLLKRAEEESGGVDEKLRYGFQIGEMNFVYETSLHCELIKAAQLYSVPNTPTWMLGLINLRGGLVPIFDLEKYFNYTPEDDKHKLLLVLGTGEQAVGFQVKHYPELLRNLDSLESLPKLLPKIEEHITAAYQYEEKKIWLELDKDSFFSTLGTQVCD